jgi:hypothetical protein
MNASSEISPRRFLLVGWVEPRNPTISVFEARSIAIEEHL